MGSNHIVVISKRSILSYPILSCLYNNNHNEVRVFLTSQLPEFSSIFRGATDRKGWTVLKLLRYDSNPKWDIFNTHFRIAIFDVISRIEQGLSNECYVRVFFDAAAAWIFINLWFPSKFINLLTISRIYVWFFFW